MLGSNQVIVLCYEDQVEPGIARSILKHRWQLVDGRSLSPVKRVLIAHPRAVIVQVPPAGEPALGVIDRLARHWTPMVVLAVAGEAMELNARQAGADCFLPTPIESDTLETVIEHMVPGATRAESPPETAGRVPARSGGTPRAVPRASGRVH